MIYGGSGAIDRRKEKRFSFSSVAGNDFFSVFLFYLEAPEDDVDWDARSLGKGANFFLSSVRFFVVIFCCVVAADGLGGISMPGDKIFGMVAKDFDGFLASFSYFWMARLPNAVPFD